MESLKDAMGRISTPCDPADQAADMALRKGPMKIGLTMCFLLCLVGMVAMYPGWISFMLVGLVLACWCVMQKIGN